MASEWSKYRNCENEVLTDEQKTFKREVYVRLAEARKRGVSAGKIAQEMCDDIHRFTICWKQSCFL